MRLSTLPALIFFLFLSAIAVSLGGYWTSLSVGNWYPTLVRPTWAPPSWVFGPVWTVLYIAMAVAAWLVWMEKPGVERPTALFAYGAQLLLNTTWSGSFFALRSPLLGLVNIVLLLVAIGFTLDRFWRVNRAAAGLLVPYFLWVSFAMALNFSIWSLNG